MAISTEVSKMRLPAAAMEIIDACPKYRVARNVEELVEWSVADAGEDGWYEVAYDVPGKGRVVEAQVCRLRNGVAANYLEPYMRRRDPDCMLIGDKSPTDKPRYQDRYGADFGPVRRETFEWLKTQELVTFAFQAGQLTQGMGAVVIAPANAGFFALGLALLQGIIDPDELPESFDPKAVIYIAPPFRHTHFDGKQVVVHNRLLGMHEIFAYNLYPGPSAKKGVYGMLLALGEQLQWVVAHCSTVEVITPYDNKLIIMHEGASGGGKSEMLEMVHRERDGRLKLGTNVTNDEERFIVLPRTCELRPVTDDMALCQPSQHAGHGKLTLMDAETSWFVRVNHITRYGIDPILEGITISPKHPQLFLNIDAAPNSTGLIWEHIQDEPGVPCPNPRVVVPRLAFPGTDDRPVEVDVRSFGVRTPPCTREHPTYGIIGVFHVLPPALAWLWRLVAPRGHGNPSIVDSGGMKSEGVGSYWPFATGRRVDQANLLLKQIAETPNVSYILTPNQHIGAWKTGFMPQWIAREYIARRGGATFSEDQILPARCPLLGYALRQVTVEGAAIGNWFLRVEKQPEVGEDGYDAGAEILTRFFHEQVQKYRSPDLYPLGQRIIECCMANGTVEDYAALISRDDRFGS